MSTIAEAQDHKHDVFISYSRKNEGFAAKLEQSLENYRPPKDLKVRQRYLEVFRDKEDFTAGEYHQNLERHLRDSAKLIVICSPAARKSQYVNDEIQRFAQMRGSEHIIPILLSGIPNNEAKPGQEEEMAFPDALCKAMAMPLAINYLGLNEQKDKVNKGIFSDSWHSMLANIYDISRSEVEQREKRRRARTRRITYSVLSGSIAVLSILLAFALVSRSQAVAAKGVAVAAGEAEAKQRRRAEEQEQVARTERDAAVVAREETKDALVKETIAKQLAEDRREEAERQRQIAEEQTLIAEERARLAQARQLAVQSILAREETTATTALGTVGKERSVLLALESFNRFRTPEGSKALHDGIAGLTGNGPRMRFTDEVGAFSLSPDGNSMVVANGGKVFLRDLSGNQSSDWLIPAENPHSIVFSPDGARLAIAGPESTLIWDVIARKQIGRLSPVPTSSQISFNPTGSRLIALTETGLSVWDVLSASVVQATTACQTRGGVLSLGGRWCATQNDAGLILVIDVETGREVHRFRGMKDDSLSTVSRDGKLVATAGFQIAHVWRVSDGRKIASLKHEWNPKTMSFSWDGGWLTTVTGKASMDAAQMTSTTFPGSAIRVWDMETHLPVMHVSLAQEGGLDSVSFAANGEKLIVAGPIIKPGADDSVEYEGTRLLSWILLPTELTRTACSLLTRNLSPSEWETFMGNKNARLTCKGLPVPEE
jgi:hypothetical protein